MSKKVNKSTQMWDKSALPLGQLTCHGLTCDLDPGASAACCRCLRTYRKRRFPQAWPVSPDTLQACAPVRPAELRRSRRSFLRGGRRVSGASLGSRGGGGGGWLWGTRTGQPRLALFGAPQLSPKLSLSLVLLPPAPPSPPPSPRSAGAGVWGTQSQRGACRPAAWGPPGLPCVHVARRKGDSGASPG